MKLIESRNYLHLVGKIVFCLHRCSSLSGQKYTSSYSLINFTNFYILWVFSFDKNGKLISHNTYIKRKDKKWPFVIILVSDCIMKNDMTWYDMIWYMIWYDIWCMIWQDVIWYMIYIVWYDMIYDIWYDVIWYDMIWYDILVNFNWVETRWQ
jgi:hypothetical protein